MAWQDMSSIRHLGDISIRYGLYGYVCDDMAESRVFWSPQFRIVADRTIYPALFLPLCYRTETPLAFFLSATTN